MLIWSSDIPTIRRSDFYSAFIGQNNIFPLSSIQIVVGLEPWNTSLHIADTNECFCSAILPRNLYLLRYDCIVHIAAVVLISLSLMICLTVLSGSCFEVPQSNHVSLCKFLWSARSFLINYWSSLLRSILRALAILEWFSPFWNIHNLHLGIKT